MHALIKAIRSFLAITLGLILFVLLIVGTLGLVATTKVTDRETLKTWFKEGKVYTSLPGIASEEIYKQLEKNPDVPIQKIISKEELGSNLANIFTPDWLEKNQNLIVNATYDWLEGKTQRPTFEIDLTDLEKRAKDTITTFVKKRLATLPACPPQNTKNKNQPKPELDAFNAACLPQGANMDEINAQIEAELSKNEIIKNKVFSSKELKLDENIIAETPKYYGYVKLYKYAFLACIIIITALVYLLAPGWKFKAIFTGTLWTLSGIILLVAGVLSKDLWPTFIKPALTSDPNIQANVIQVLDSPLQYAISDLSSRMQIYALLIFIVGVLLTVSFLLHKKKKDRYEFK